MKKTILIFAIIIFAGSLSAQVYRPLAQFNGDIDKYLYFNFETQNEAYVGKTFAYLMEKLEIQPVGFDRTMSFINGLNDDSYDIRIDLVCKYHSVNNKYSPYDSYIRIVWETPIRGSLVRNLISQYPGEIWVSQHYEFFKNMKIKAIRINDSIVHREGYKSNPEFELTATEKKKLKKDKLLQ